MVASALVACAWVASELVASGFVGSELVDSALVSTILPCPAERGRRLCSGGRSLLLGDAGVGDGGLLRRALADLRLAGLWRVLALATALPRPRTGAPGADVPGADVPGASIPGAGIPGAGIPGVGECTGLSLLLLLS